MTLGGFERAGRLLEYDQVLAQVASYCRTVLGRERVTALEPSEDLLEVATRQQENDRDAALHRRRRVSSNSVLRTTSAN